jgi:hypothetical protein
VTLDVSVLCEHSLRTDGAYLEGDGATNRVEIISLPPDGVNLQALLYMTTDESELCIP